MKTTLDKQDGLSRKLKIEVPESKVNDAFDKIYTGIQSEVTIKGFRKGKAPMNQVKSLYADRVNQDVLNELISKAYSEALEEHSLDPIGNPQLDMGKLEEGATFEFSAQFEIRPEINLTKYEGLKVEKEQFELKEEELNNILENIRTQNSETSPMLEDRPAQSGDVAKIDFEGKVDGAPLEGGKADDFSLELGSDSFIPGFEEGVIGMKVGSSKELKLSFPADYHSKDIAGKEVVFAVSLKGLEKKTLPELNDELAAKLGDFKSLDELKDMITKDISKREQERITTDLRNRVLKVLTENNPVEVPVSLKEQQKARLVQDIQQRMQQQGMNPGDFDEYKQKWDQDFEKSASTMVQSTFLVDALASKLEISADEQEVERKIKEHAGSMGLDLERLREFYSTPEKRSNLRFQIVEEKVVDYLIEKAEITEVPKDKLQPEE